MSETPQTDDVLVLPADPDVPIPLVPADDVLCGAAARQVREQLAAVRLDQLPDGVRALLAAVRDAIDLPIATWTEADERAHHQLLKDRATIARITLDGILDNGHGLPTSTGWLTERTAELPVTYTVWVPRDTEGGEPR